MSISSQAFDKLIAAKDAEIAKLRAERDEVKRTLVSLFDDTKAEMKRLRADLDQACRDRISAVECAEVLRGYVAEGKAEIAKLRAERAIHLASIAEHSQKLAAARAALDGEQKACDIWRSMFVLIPADCADSVPLAEFNGQNHREHGAIGAACKTHDARRAAEAKCDGCDSTRARCDGAKAGGAIKCCPDCGHGAAEAKSSPYPFPIVSSPSAPDGTIVAMRDGKVVGAITDIAAEAKE